MRLDHRKICFIIPTQAKVLDLGCGNGELLELLTRNKQIEGSGIEISPSKMQEAIAKGMSVIQGDLEDTIKDYRNGQFDYCILSQTLQDLKHPEGTLKEMLRVGKKVIITFYNLAYWRYRIHIMFKGTFPKSKDLPYEWLTTNILFLSVKDFEAFCEANHIHIVQTLYFAHEKQIHFWPNVCSTLCIFEIARD
jgi:methionine biosynthesis protein MetW